MSDLWLRPPGRKEAHAVGMGTTLHWAIGGRAGRLGGPSVQTEWKLRRQTTEALPAPARSTWVTECNWARWRGRLGGGAHVVVASRRQQAADQAMFRHAGAELADGHILVLKSSAHFHADFGSLASRILIVAAEDENGRPLPPLLSQAQIRHRISPLGQALAIP